MLAVAMSAPGSRIAVAVVVLTALICVVVVAGDGPIGGGGAALPSRTPRRLADLREVGVITDDFPVPGALPPEVFPAEEWGISPPGPPAWLPWALVGLVLLWLGVRLARQPATWRIQRPRTAPEAAPPEDDAHVARRAVDAALEPLREPADPRAAVIEAYARMEHVLSGRELGRRASEAPREYLRRVLAERGAPEASLTTLTELFEEARFSRHPITEAAARYAERELEAARLALQLNPHWHLSLASLWCHTGAMDLTTYVERLRSELGVTETGGEAAVRLMLLDALSAAADEITREIAPATVEVRLRGGEPEFVVTPVPADEPAPEVAPPEGDDDGAHQPAPPGAAEGRRRAGRDP